MKLNTPTAIFLGLALIAVAIFFRQPSISEAQANSNSVGTYVGWASPVNHAKRETFILNTKTRQVWKCSYDTPIACMDMYGP
jgi:hypothetical protein